MASFPLVPFARFLIYVTSALWANWDSIVRQFNRADAAASSPVLGYYMVAYGGMRVAAGDSFPERWQCGVHFINITDDGLDTTWVDADYAAVESAFGTFWSAIGANVPSSFRLEGYKWYAFGPSTFPPNPPVRTTVLGTPVAGGAGTNTAHQIASTVTLRTALRRHWGRFYVPIAAGALDSYGQLPDATVDALASAAKTFLHAAWTSQGILPVVWDRVRHSVFSVTAIEVDSVPDIIRRRRPKLERHRSVLTS